jgi:diguanylate cyclase (GGDEF)-like protein/PAS domain S-box-containing protein
MSHRTIAVRRETPSIQAHVLLLVGLLLLALASSLVYETIGDIDRDVSITQGEATRIADVTATRAEQFLVRGARILEEMSLDPDVRALDRQRCDDSPDRARRLEPAFRNVFTLDSGHEIVCSTSPGSAAAALRPELKAVEAALRRTTGLALSFPVKVDDRWITLLVVPLRVDGVVSGVVAAEVDLAAIQPLVEQWRAPGVIIGVMDGTGALVARSEDSARRIGRIVDSQAAKLIMSLGRGSGKASGADGVERLIAATPVRNTSWIAFVAFDARHALAAARHDAWQRLGYALAVTLAVALFSFFVLRRITRPIAAVSSAIAGVRAGDVEARAEPEGPQEMRDFAKALNAMLDERLDVESRLREKSQQLQLFIRHAPAAIAMLDGDMRYMAVSDRWRLDYRLGDTDLAGRSHYEIFPDLPEHWKEIHRRCLAGATERKDEDSFVRADGTVDWIHWEIHPWRDDNDEIGGLLLFSEVITERKLAQDRIKRLNRVYAMLSNINGLIVRVRGRQQLFDESARIAAEHGGFGIVWIGLLAPDSLAVRPVAVSGSDADWHLSNLALLDVETLLTRGGLFNDCFVQQRATWTNDLAAAPSSAHYRRGLVERGYQSAIVLPLRFRNRMLGFISMITTEPDFFNAEEVKLAEEVAGDIAFAADHLDTERKALYLAYYDGLTGLSNQSLFLEHVAHALHDAEGTGRNVVLVLADIRRFRLINDTFGRHAGDDVLGQIAGRLRASASRPENLARVGPNCFAKFITDVGDTVEIARRVETLIASALREPLPVGESTLNIAFAVGVAIYPQDGADAETLFRNADAALAGAKAQGSALQFFEPQTNQRVAGTLALESKLRKAVELDQFVLHYQPKVRLADGAVVGLEALLRWQDPEGGLVSPAKFIPLLEETGMIVDVGNWVLQRAAADWLDWAARDLDPPPIAVNVSSLQLRQRTFIDSVLSAIDRLPVNPVPLHLEITESMIMEDMSDTVQKLHILRGLGIEVAIDDFGTGYSSLGYISSLPVDALKIDRSFISPMEESEYSRTVVTMIVTLAKTLRLRVIAEGVETEAQADILRGLGCEEMQGYLISRPQPLAELEPWLRATRAARA